MTKREFTQYAAKALEAFARQPEDSVDVAYLETWIDSFGNFLRDSYSVEINSSLRQVFAAQVDAENRCDLAIKQGAKRVRVLIGGSEPVMTCGVER